MFVFSFMNRIQMYGFIMSIMLRMIKIITDIKKKSESLGWLTKKNYLCIAILNKGCLI